MTVVFCDKRGKETGMNFSGIFPMQYDRHLLKEDRRDVDLPCMQAESVQLSMPDIDVLYGTMTMKESQTAWFNSIDEPDHIEMHFTLAGDGCLENHISGKKICFSTNEQNLHYMPGFVGSSEYRKGYSYKFFEIRLAKKFFLELTENSSPVLMQFADNIASGRTAEVFERNLPISFSMHQCIGEIMRLQLADGLKRMFLQSKCIELLTLQAQAYEESDGKITRTCKTVYDKERIYFVRDYLEKHAACPPSFSELVKMAGLNEFKLKKGFKEVFNTTVFGYLSDFRLNEARNGLLSGTSIKEVSEELGYSSVQHFTRAFKEKFGVPPGRVKRD